MVLFIIQLLSLHGVLVESICPLSGTMAERIPPSWLSGRLPPENHSTAVCPQMAKRLPLVGRWRSVTSLPARKTVRVPVDWETHRATAADEAVMSAAAAWRVPSPPGNRA